MTTRTDVLVVGAGPVGLSLAIELGHRGIGCLVVERNDRVGYSPRAKTTNVRSREHLRRWGIADALRQASPIAPDYPPDVVFATRMNGHELARFENAFNGRRVRDERYSEEAQWVPQYTVEEVMRTHATSLPGVAVTFDTELNSFRQDGDGVTSEVTDLRTGDTRTVHSAYLVGADGARSFVREAIGARMAGSKDALRNYSIIFRAPELRARATLDDAIMYWMVNGEVPGLLGPMDMHGLWFFMATKLPGNADPEGVDPVHLIRTGTGLAGLPIEIIRNDPWTAHSLVADRYADGRAFLAGDACHLHPPFGGFGMNMGIGDAVDLGWKLAATLQGWGGPALLGTYQTERRPVQARTIHESQINYASLGTPSPAPNWSRTARLPRPFAARSVPPSRRPRTASSIPWASCSARATRAPRSWPRIRPIPRPSISATTRPSAYPGCLAPHAWLADGSSLYDHFGVGLTLLVLGATPRA